MRAPRTAPLGALLAILCIAAAPAVAKSVDYPDPAGYCQEASNELDPRDLGTVPLDPLPPGVSERFVRLAGVRTPLLEAGAASSRLSVVFVHGNLGSSRDFAGMMSASRSLGLRLLAFDLPGFGRAEHPWWFPYTEAGEVRWLTDALDQLGARRVILVFHDLGGPISLQWAAEHPSRFLGAAMFDSGVYIGWKDHYLATIWKTPVAGETFMAQLTRREFSFGANYGQRKPLPAEYVDREYSELDRPMRCALLSMYRDIDDFDPLGREQAAALRPLDRPGLVIWGANDPYTSVSMAAHQRDAFPHADIHIFGDAGHWPFVDDPQPATALVHSFLQRWSS